MRFSFPKPYSSKRPIRPALICSTEFDWFNWFGNRTHTKFGDRFGSNSGHSGLIPLVSVEAIISFFAATSGRINKANSFPGSLFSSSLGRPRQKRRDTLGTRLPYEILANHKKARVSVSCITGLCNISKKMWHGSSNDPRTALDPGPQMIPKLKKIKAETDTT